MRDIHAILLDLGNVVIKLNPSALETGYGAYSKTAEKEIEEYILDSDDMNRYMEGKLSSRQFYGKVRRRFKMNIDYDEFYGIWNSMFLGYPEMEEIIRALKEKYPEIKLILISNTNEAHYDFIKDKFDILELLDGHIVSHELGVQKPDPKIFSEAMKLAGSIPKTTFYTDDREDLISAARAMGIKAFQFTGHGGFRSQLAKYGIEV
ncbi:MAG: HAD family phosphatase [Candidatus Omnitrophota bacterium]